MSLLPTDASNFTAVGAWVVKVGTTAQVNTVTPGPSLVTLVVREVSQEGSTPWFQATAMTRHKTDHKASPLCAESIQGRLCEEKKKKFYLPHFKPFVVKLTTVLDMSQRFSTICTIR